MKKLFIFAIVALGMLACSDKNAPSYLSYKEGALNGKFSVNDSTQVQFSRGNLQYNANKNIWQFAENQCDYIGEDNCKSQNIYDLFDWGTGDNPILEHYQDYDIFIDWGNNIISNGGNTTNVWRTLTMDEWIYLLHGRLNAENLFGFGTLNEIKGFIILPDNWETSNGSSFVASTNMGLTWIYDFYSNSNENNFTHNTYTTATWEKMENEGAVFLPAAGWKGEKGVYYENMEGFYWSSSSHGEGLAYNIFFSKKILSANGSSRNSGCSVRLVHHVSAVE